MTLTPWGEFCLLQHLLKCDSWFMHTHNGQLFTTANIAAFYLMGLYGSSIGSFVTGLFCLTFVCNPSIHPPAIHPTLYEKSLRCLPGWRCSRDAGWDLALKKNPSIQPTIHPSLYPSKVHLSIHPSVSTFQTVFCNQINYKIHTLCTLYDLLALVYSHYVCLAFHPSTHPSICPFKKQSVQTMFIHPVKFYPAIQAIHPVIN